MSNTTSDAEARLPRHNGDDDLHMFCDQDIVRLGRENDALKAEHPRADGTPRMTTAQMLALWRLCGRYNVPFREDDYLLHSTESGFTPGYVEGWLGGSLHAAGNPNSTIYVGVDPSGRVNS
jgi:hypothetical protein